MKALGLDEECPLQALQLQKKKISFQSITNAHLIVFLVCTKNARLLLVSEECRLQTHEHAKFYCFRVWKYGFFPELVTLDKYKCLDHFEEGSVIRFHKITDSSDKLQIRNFYPNLPTFDSDTSLSSCQMDCLFFAQLIVHGKRTFFRFWR